MSVFDNRPCSLGEGAFWHPVRRQFFWFDILAGRLLSRGPAGPLEWPIGRMASAAAWVDADRLVIATETGLCILDLRDGAQTPLPGSPVPATGLRSNDGRADRQGGVWFSTMGKAAERGAGGIWRWHRGEARQVVRDITIPNAICFAPDGRTAYYADTAIRRLWAQPLDADGWPDGERRLVVNFGPAEINPDGAVVDSDGALNIACWGAGKVLRLAPGGAPLGEVAVGGRHSSCPAHGGEGLRDLLVTTALQDIDDPGPAEGLTYVVPAPAPGLPEPQVIA